MTNSPDEGRQSDAGPRRDLPLGKATPDATQGTPAPASSTPVNTLKPPQTDSAKRSTLENPLKPARVDRPTAAASNSLKPREPERPKAKLVNSLKPPQVPRQTRKVPLGKSLKPQPPAPKSATLPP